MQFPFVGPTYVAPSLYQDDQDSINLYCEKDSTKADGERGQYTLYPTPGFTTVLQPTSGEVRGMLTVQSGAVLLVIIGSNFYSLASDFTFSLRGTLTTNSLPVRITENGSYAYFADVQNRYAYNFSTNAFTTISNLDGPFVGGTTADFIDGFIIYADPNSNNWGATSLNSIVSPALSVGQENAVPGNLVGLIANNREVFLLSTNSSSVWVDAGAFPFPFQRSAGTTSQHGCVSAASISRLGNSFAYVSQDTRGQGIIVVMNGYSPAEISNHAVTSTLENKYLGDSRAFTYQLGGHEFYVVTFPSIDLTWVYDAATGWWHKWLYMDNFGVYHRARHNCQAVFQGLMLTGDYENGSIYSISNEVYTDGGQPIRRLRRCTHLVAGFLQQYFASLQLQFQPGVGLAIGQGQDPQAMLRWSNDGGSTWSQEHWKSIGKIGRYKNRAVWRRLGTARDRVYEVSVSDPIKCVIVSAELVAEVGDN